MYTIMTLHLYEKNIKNNYKIQYIIFVNNILKLGHCFIYLFYIQNKEGQGKYRQFETIKNNHFANSNRTDYVFLLY